jgi:hypothetical protein
MIQAKVGQAKGG